MKEEINIRALTPKEVRRIGKFDKGDRFYPYEDYVVEGSFLVRNPSRAHPYSFYKHALTLKYAKLLANHRPDLWESLTGEKL